MAIKDQIRVEKLQYDTNRDAAKNRFYHQAKFINMNILQVEIYHHLISNK